MTATISGDGTSTLINLTTSGNTVLGDASTDTLNVGNGGLVKDASGNLGIGTVSPTGGANRVVDVYGSGSSAINFHNATSGTTTTDGGVVGQYGSDLVLYNYEAGIIQFGTSNAERARIDSSGNLLVGTTSGANARIRVDYSSQTYGMRVGTTATSGTAMQFVYEPSTQVGTITTTTSATNYGSGSDYRLKDNVTQLTGALEKVALLKPVNWKWKIDGSYSQGFIAHELQAVIPDAVVGEKDAVNEDGSIKPQMVDTSFLVATLTAAIQELKAIITQLQADVEALKAQGINNG